MIKNALAAMSGLYDTWHTGIMCLDNVEIRGNLKAPNLELPDKLTLEDLEVSKTIKVKDLKVTGKFEADSIKLPKKLSVTDLKAAGDVEVKNLKVTGKIEMPAQDPIKELELDDLSSSNIESDCLSVRDKAQLPSSVRFGSESFDYFKSACAKSLKSKSFPVAAGDSTPVVIPLSSLKDSNKLFIPDKKGGYTYRGAKTISSAIELGGLISLSDSCDLEWFIAINDVAYESLGKISFRTGCSQILSRAFVKIKTDDKVSVIVYNGGDRVVIDLLSINLQIGPR